MRFRVWFLGRCDGNVFAGDMKPRTLNCIIFIGKPRKLPEDYSISQYYYFSVFFMKKQIEPPKNCTSLKGHQVIFPPYAVTNDNNKLFKLLLNFVVYNYHLQNMSDAHL